MASDAPQGSTRRQFIGQATDPQTALSYLNARYYQGSVGRFLSEDPATRGVPGGQFLANPQSLNTYAYAEGNPVLKSDPTGEFAFFPLLAIIVGVAIAFFTQPAIVQAPTPYATVNTAYYQAAQAQASTLNLTGMAAGVTLSAPAVAKGIVALGTAGVKAVTGVVTKQTTSVQNTAAPVTNIVSREAGYSSYPAFKNEVGPAGDGMQWHHIVEQNPVNKAQFVPEMLQNQGNIVAIPTRVHQQISGYFSSKDPAFPGYSRVRDWVSEQPFEDQYSFGLQKLTEFLGQ